MRGCGGAGDIGLEPDKGDTSWAHRDGQGASCIASCAGSFVVRTGRRGPSPHGASFCDERSCLAESTIVAVTAASLLAAYRGRQLRRRDRCG